MLRAVVIDDIETIRKKNISIIKSNCPNISVIGQADCVTWHKPYQAIVA